MKTYKLGIALCGGAVRGIAHAGVLKALEEHSIYPECISGASMGSIIGALYAEGLEPKEILDVASKVNSFSMVSIGFPIDGLTNLSFLKRTLKKNIEEDDFNSLQKKLYICVTNLSKGKTEYISEGKLSTVVLASCAIPMLFKPVKVNGDLCVDGGITDNLPILPLKNTCEKIIGVNVNGFSPEVKGESMFSIGERSANLMLGQQVRQNLDSCDVSIEIEEVYKYGAFDFSSAKKIFEAGYEQTLNQIDEIKNKLKKGLFRKIW